MMRPATVKVTIDKKIGSRGIREFKFFNKIPPNGNSPSQTSLCCHMPVQYFQAFNFGAKIISHNRIQTEDFETVNTFYNVLWHMRCFIFCEVVSV